MSSPGLAVRCMRERELQVLCGPAGVVEGLYQCGKVMGRARVISFPVHHLMRCPRALRPRHQVGAGTAVAGVS